MLVIVDDFAESIAVSFADHKLNIANSKSHSVHDTNWPLGILLG